jgi:hypothetical protein
MSITIKSNIKINSKTRIGTLNVPPTPTPTPTQTITPTPTPTPTITPTITPSNTFYFNFSQTWNEPSATVSSIGGFTSTPPFTPTSGSFGFSSIGSPIGSIRFSFFMSAPISATIGADLIINGITYYSIVQNIDGGAGFEYPPVTISVNDTVAIQTYVPD